MTIIGQRSRSQVRYIAFWRYCHIIISQKLNHRTFSKFLCRHLFVCPIKWNNKNLGEQINDVTKIVNIWRLTCKTPIPKLLFLIKTSKKIKKNMAVIQPRPTHILYQCAKLGDDRSFWRVRRLTCKKPMPIFGYMYLASKVCSMLKYSNIYDIWIFVIFVIFN